VLPQISISPIRPAMAVLRREIIGLRVVTSGASTARSNGV
jgi:hypothetical protein